MRRFHPVPLGLLGLLSVLTLAACGSLSDRAPPAGEPSFYQSMARPGARLDLAAAQSMISGYRRNNGLSAVVVDPALTRMAEQQARAMAARNVVEHTVGGRTFIDRMKASGFDGKFAVENVGAGYHTLAEAFSGWRDSPSHRANMLRGGATHMGIAAIYAPNSKYKVFWCLVLAAADDSRS
ncbi:MAG: CAP domain-containing protein [Variibacter sp.]|nr:CAP domain-containing protein [Variibacter sp.]